MHVDTVLYMKRGRAEGQAVLSVKATDPDAAVKIAATQQHHIEQAIKAGAPLPTFEVVAGRPTKTKESA